MSLLQRVSEGLARKTTRRALFGRGADVAFGALAGAAAGTLSNAGGVSAGGGTITCCDCDCQGINGFNSCGCGSDYHNKPVNCP